MLYSVYEKTLEFSLKIYTKKDNPTQMRTYFFFVLIQIFTCLLSTPQQTLHLKYINIFKSRYI